MMTQGCDLAPSCAANKRFPSYLIHNHSEKKIVNKSDYKIYFRLSFQSASR